jgi:hypothetical protein
VLVDLLGEVGDALAQLRGQAGVFVGEGEGFEAGGFYVAWAIFKSASGGQRPFNVQLAGKHAKRESIIQCNCEERVVRK